MYEKINLYEKNIENALDLSVNYKSIKNNLFINLKVKLENVQKKIIIDMSTIRLMDLYCYFELYIIHMIFILYIRLSF